MLALAPARRKPPDSRPHIARKPRRGDTKPTTSRHLCRPLRGLFLSKEGLLSRLLRAWLNSFGPSGLLGQRPVICTQDVGKA